MQNLKILGASCVPSALQSKTTQQASAPWIRSATRISHYLSGHSLKTRGCKKEVLAWPSLQSLAVKKKLFFVQILGGEKLLKFGEKWAVKNF